MSRLRKLARLVETRAEPERLYAELSTCPLRLAFIIREDLDLAHLAQILEYNSALWGGYYSCLIPTDGQTIEQDWWHNLCLYRPDKIVFCGDRGEPVFSTELSGAILDELQPFSLHNWYEWDEQNSAIEPHEHGLADRSVQAMPMVHPLQYELDNLRNPIEEGKSNVRIPSIENTNPLYLCVIAQVGLAKDIYHRAYRELFKAEVIDFKSDDLGNYLERLSKFDGRECPLSLTGHLHITQRTTKLRPGRRPEGLSIVLIGTNWVRDICLFWNLRLAESGFGRNFKELLLPIDLLRSPRNLLTLTAALQSDSSWHTHKITLLSSSVSSSRLKRLEERLGKHLRGWASVKTVKNLLPIADFQLKSTTESREIILEGDHFSFRRPMPEFGEIAKGGEWAVSIKFHRPYEFPVFSKLNHMLCGSLSDERIQVYGGYWLRYADGKLICRVGRGTNFVGGCLIRATDAFQEVFQDKGFDTQLSERHAYTEGLLKLLGSPKLLEKSGIRDLFWLMQNGTTYTFNEMKSYLKIGSECDSVIDTLVQRRVLLRGMCFECESCGLSRWYPINTLDEEMQCAGCLKLIRPPSRAPIVFRLNELAATAVSQGSIPVLLTQRMLAEYSLNRSLSLFGLKVTKNGLESDVDLITTYQGYLVLAECKDFKDGVLPKEKRKALRQLSVLAKVAERVGAPIALLSTLLPGDAPEVAEFAERIRRLNKRGYVAVHLLSLSQMKFVNLRNPTETIEYPNLFYGTTN